MLNSRRHLLAALGLLPCTVLAHAPAPAGPSAVGAGMQAGIHPWLEAGDSLVAEVLADGKVVEQLDHRSTRVGLPRLPATTVALPAGVQRLQLRGTVTVAGKATRFNRTWKVRDLGNLSAPLYDQRRPWPERVRALVQAIPVPEGEDAPLTMAPAKPADTAFPALEKRLGAPLLPAMVQLLAACDIRLGRSHFVQPAAMTTLLDLMHGDFGYPSTGKDASSSFLPPGVRERYARSLAVFVTIGDGVGALAWDPKGLTPEDHALLGSSPGPATGSDGGVWYWMHQEMAVKPSLLLDRDGHPLCTDLALASVFERYALGDLFQPMTDDELVLDSATPLGNLLQLYFDHARNPRLGVNSYNGHYGDHTQY